MFYNLFIILDGRLCFGVRELGAKVGLVYIAGLFGSLIPLMYLDLVFFSSFTLLSSFQAQCVESECEWVSYCYAMANYSKSSSVLARRLRGLLLLLCEGSSILTFLFAKSRPRYRRTLICFMKPST